MICSAISAGVMPDRLAYLQIGPVSHSRWLATALRFYRIWVAHHKLKFELLRSQPRKVVQIMEQTVRRSSCIMRAIPFLVSSLLAMTWFPLSATARNSDGPATVAAATVLGSLVLEHLPTCNLVLLGDDVSAQASDLISVLDTHLYPRVLLQVGGTRKEEEKDDDDKGNSTENHHLFREILTKETTRSTCLSIILYASTSKALDLILGVLEDAGLFLHPDVFLLWRGPEDKAHQTLSHAALRNSVNLLYLAISLHIHRLPNWRPRSGFDDGFLLFRDQFRNFNGHTFRIVTMPWFPYIELEGNPVNSSEPLRPLDSLDYRMVDSISRTLNFTFEYRMPSDGEWGQSTPSGNWTGTVGTLQHHLADFSCILAWMESRYAVVEYSRIYSTEPLVMIMSKPKALPQWQALVRPFEAETWVAILVTVGVVGLVLWTLQRGWSWVSGRKVVKLDTAVLQVWAILLEDPPTSQPSNVSGQMIIGWWWVYCMLVTIVYKSALTAHLTIPGKSPTIDSLEQLLEQDHWTWGFEPTYGSGWQYFKTSTNPTIKSIFEGFQVKVFEDQMNQVLAGRHAFLTWKYYIQYRIAARYTNAFGYTPIYKAKQEYLNYGGYGWGFRKGAPFRKRLDEMTQRLVQAGLIDFWLDDLIFSRARRERQQKERQASSSAKSSTIVNTVLHDDNTRGGTYRSHASFTVFPNLFTRIEALVNDSPNNLPFARESRRIEVRVDDSPKQFPISYPRRLKHHQPDISFFPLQELRETTEGEVVLGLHHLQGAFYLLMVCYSLALVALWGEVALSACRPKK
ncbi:uncharacterized protein LOC143030037 [Oratosquilla oratoria]|uniref:uncharacterized protein LOC143030037 n=1 Tax=Oratosquilla oratoria TaxID=337810 RepID=UPI003F76196C